MKYVYDSGSWSTIIVGSIQYTRRGNINIEILVSLKPYFVDFTDYKMKILGYP